MSIPMIGKYLKPKVVYSRPHFSGDYETSMVLRPRKGKIMNVASLRLSKGLYELSGWDDSYGDNPDELYHYYPARDDIYNPGSGIEMDDSIEGVFPLYDLGYLLRKLPSEIQDSDGYRYRLRCGKNQYYFFEYQSTKDDSIRWRNISPFSKDSPEDALCKLAIELFKQGILTKENV